jgi:acetyl-CoA carboxylase carboxyl transferase subunit alpha
MSTLKTKILVVVTGEGGSGGALALGVGDHISILEYGTYSVASPEACASIVWRESAKAPEAAEAMKVGASDLKKIGIVDEIITEPIGGAHQDYDSISSNIKSSLLTNIAELSKFSEEDLLNRRYQRLLKIGS